MDPSVRAFARRLGADSRFREFADILEILETGEIDRLVLAAANDRSNTLNRRIGLLVQSLIEHKRKAEIKMETDSESAMEMGSDLVKLFSALALDSRK